MGSICEGLEPACPRLPSETCLSQLHIFHEGQQAHGDSHYILPLRLRSRTCYVVLVQKVERLFAYSTNVPAPGKFLYSNCLDDNRIITLSQH